MDNQQPIGVILLQDEPVGHVAVKWLGWLIVMILFVIILIWFAKYFEKPYCDFDQYRFKPPDKK